MKKNNNSIGISPNPYTFERVFKGRCNGETFTLTHSGRYNAGTEEIEESLDVMWLLEDPKRATELEEGIRAVFRKRLDAERGN